ncbi:MAG: extracellular solute-binding protein [Clostridiales bacterium]|nr:extracellular solute-binding protein [Clostridiales bacterium]
MKKKLALILVFGILLSILAGCAGTGDDPAGTDPTEKPAETPAATPEDEATAGDDEGEVENLNLTGFPIVNETIYLKGFGGRSPDSQPWEECVLHQLYEEMTNIKIEWELADVENIAEVRNIKLASGVLPDLFFQARVPVIDQMTYGANGMFVPLNDLIDKYAPNIKAMLEDEGYSDVKKMWTMPDGKIYSISGVVAPDNKVGRMPQKWWIKMSYVEECNDGKIPETTEELYQFLKNVKAKYPELTPLSCHRFRWIRRHFKGSFGLGNRSAYTHEYVSWDEENNTVVVDITTDRYKEMLKYLNRLYTEDLLDPMIFTQEMASYVANGKEHKYAIIHGNTPGVFGFTEEEWNTEGQENSWYCGVILEGPYGDKIMSTYMPQSFMPGQFVITSANKYPEATMRWVVYFMDGAEGSLFVIAGVEGVSFDIDPETGLRVAYKTEETGKQYTWTSSYPVYISSVDIINGGHPTPDTPYGRALDLLYETRPESVWGEFTYTKEETERMATLKADIEPYIEEVEAKLITGEMSFDEWDNIQNNLKKMGLDEYIEIYNIAAKRFEGN